MSVALKELLRWMVYRAGTLGLNLPALGSCLALCFMREMASRHEMVDTNRWEFFEDFCLLRSVTDGRVC